MDNLWGGAKKVGSGIGRGIVKIADSVGIVKVIDSSVAAVSSIVGIETPNSPLMCAIDGEQRKTQVNTQYMRNPDIAYVLEMEYGGKFWI